MELQHAVTVNAAPEQVWMWLVQLGQDRAGTRKHARSDGLAEGLADPAAADLLALLEGRTTQPDTDPSAIALHRKLADLRADVANAAKELDAKILAACERSFDSDKKTYG